MMPLSVATQLVLAESGFRPLSGSRVHALRHVLLPHQTDLLGLPQTLVLLHAAEP